MLNELNNSLKFQICLNNKSISCISQHNNKKSHKNFTCPCDPWNLFDPLPNIQTAIGLIYASEESYLRVLNTVLTFKKHYKEVYARQDTLARKSGVSLSTFKRALKFWERHGFIGVKNNGANKTCWYKVSSWFRDLDVQKILSKKLTIFYFSIFNLLSGFKPVNYEDPNVFNLFLKQQQQQLYHSMDRVVGNVEKVSQKGVNKMSNILSQIKDELKLSNHQLDQLKEFDDKILSESLQVLKENSNIDYPFKFLLKVCRNKLNKGWGSGFKKEVVKEKTVVGESKPHTSSPLDRDDLTVMGLKKYQKKIDSVNACIDELQSNLRNDLDRRLLENYKRILSDNTDKYNAIVNHLKTTKEPIKSEEDFEVERLENAISLVERNHKQTIGDAKNLHTLKDKLADILKNKQKYTQLNENDKDQQLHHKYDINSLW